MSRLPLLLASLLVLCGCQTSSEAPASKQTPAAPAPKPRPPAEPMLFPKAGLLSSEVSDAPLFGNQALPAGNVAEYRVGANSYSLFHIRTASALDAAILLSNYKATLTGVKVEAGFGGFSGLDGQTPVFVFAKDKYLLGVRGLPAKQADGVARQFAALVR